MTANRRLGAPLLPMKAAHEVGCAWRRCCLAPPRPMKLMVKAQGELHWMASHTHTHTHTHTSTDVTQHASTYSGPKTSQFHKSLRFQIAECESQVLLQALQKNFRGEVQQWNRSVFWVRFGIATVPGFLNCGLFGALRVLGWNPRAESASGFHWPTLVRCKWQEKGVGKSDGTTGWMEPVGARD